MNLTFSFEYFQKSFALITVTVMSQQSQRSNVTEVDLQHNAWDFPEGSPGNSNDPLESRYLQRILELSDGDSTSAFSSEGMLLFRFISVVFKF